MKTLNCLFVALVGGLTSVIASDKENGQFGLTGGYVHLAGFNESNQHNTHPDDFFLRNANVPGSAGETEINDLDFFKVGAFWQKEFFKDWLVKFEAGVLIGANRDDKKNVNDPRPDANGAFIYSDAKWGLYCSADMTYEVGKFYFGGQVCLNDVFVAHGWDRFGSDDPVEEDNVFLPTFGPVIGYNFSEDMAVELSAQFGEVNGGSLILRYSF